MSSRRDVLRSALAGSGLMLLRAAAVGLPVCFLENPSAWADDRCSPPILSDPTAPDFLLMSLSALGDPLNANTPGSYVSGVVNNPHTEMAPTHFNLGAYPTVAALPWSQLPADMLARTAFVHHRTGAGSHNQFSQVTRLMGAVKGADGRGEESLPAAVAQETASALGSLQVEPVVVGRSQITMGGIRVTQLSPKDLLDLFTPGAATLANLAGLRDQTIDALHAKLKATGSQTQKRFLDRYVAGRGQARALGDCLGTLLEELPVVTSDANGAHDQILAAIALFKLNVTPAVAMNMPFGGDNHVDPDFTTERDQTIASIDALDYMWTKLTQYGLADRVTFGTLNTFGRTLLRADDGRTHNQDHHVMTIVSRRIAGGVYGGLARVGTDYGATAIDSSSGASVLSGGDIAFEDTMLAAAKTLVAAVGLASDRIDKRINGGKVIRAAMQT